MKKCCECKKEKDLTEFHKNRDCKQGVCPDCKECRNKRYKNAYKNSETVRKRVLDAQRKAYQSNPEKSHLRSRKKYKTLLEKIFEILGDKCSICNFADKRVMQIDHIDGGGAKHRKSINGSWWRYYNQVLDSLEKKEDKFRILCANCNLVEAVVKGHKKSVWN